jgi:hypothetical protein
MDLLRREKDRQDVRQRIERFVQGQNIITGENRVHFISAQAALDAILTGTKDENLEDFQSFTQSIEKFLTVERGSLEIKQTVTKINALIQKGLAGLHQSEEFLDGKIQLSQAAHQEIIEQIGEASGRDIRIKLLANEITELAFEQTNESWNEWIEELGERLANKVEKWSSQHNPIFDQQKLRQDYVNQFLHNLQQEIDNWGNRELRDKILKQNLEVLDECIQEELNELQKSLATIDRHINANFSNQIDLAINGIKDSLGDFWTYVSGGLFAGGLGAGLLILVGLGGPIMWAVAGVSTAIAGALGFGMGSIHDQIKLKVFESGCDKFVEAKPQLMEKISETISLVFESRVEAATKVIEQAISLCENLLEQQEKIHKETLEQRDAEKAWLSQQRQELEKVQKNIEAILPS